MLLKFQRIFLAHRTKFRMGLPSAMGKKTLQILADEQKNCVNRRNIQKPSAPMTNISRETVEYLLCGTGRQGNTKVLSSSIALRRKSTTQCSKLGVERGTPPMYDEEKDEMIGATGTGLLVYVEWETNGEDQKGAW